MALTNIQRKVCRLLAKQRIASDLDLFHDTAAALAATWSADRAALFDSGYEIEVVRERPTFVEAIVRHGTEAVILQWSHDSAFRFFPRGEIHFHTSPSSNAFTLSRLKAGRLAWPAPSSSRRRALAQIEVRRILADWVYSDHIGRFRFCQRRCFQHSGADCWWP